MRRWRSVEVAVETFARCPNWQDLETLARVGCRESVHAATDGFSTSFYLVQQSGYGFRS